MRELTKAEHLQIKNLRQNGYNLAPIAHKIGITKKELRNYCKKNKI
jgi:hypothetical protein